MKKTKRVNTLSLLVIATIVTWVVPAAWAEELHFVAGEPGAGESIWEPNVVLIDEETDLKGGLTFTLHNPTKVEQVLAVADAPPRARQV